jgi:hypothetical protein
MEYTLSLALVDFLPVIFTAIGLGYLMQMIRHIQPELGRVALVGSVLTVAGGASKATWKLIMALSEGRTNITLLDDSLFILMAPGYVLLTWAVWQAVRVVRGKSTMNVWVPPLVMVSVIAATSVFLAISQPESPAWERVLLSVMVLATMVTSILLIIFAFRQKMVVAGGLFIVNILGVFILNGLARLPDQTIALQWVEESINVVAWLAFAFAAFQILQYTRNNFGVGAPATG